MGNVYEYKKNVIWLQAYGLVDDDVVDINCDGTMSCWKPTTDDAAKEDVVNVRHHPHMRYNKGVLNSVENFWPIQKHNFCRLICTRFRTRFLRGFILYRVKKVFEDVEKLGRSGSSQSPPSRTRMFICNCLAMAASPTIELENLDQRINGDSGNQMCSNGEYYYYYYYYSVTRVQVFQSDSKLAPHYYYDRATGDKRDAAQKSHRREKDTRAPEQNKFGRYATKRSRDDTGRSDEKVQEEDKQPENSRGHKFYYYSYDGSRKGSNYYYYYKGYYFDYNQGHHKYYRVSANTNKENSERADEKNEEDQDDPRGESEED